MRRSVTSVHLSGLIGHSLSAVSRYKFPSIFSELFANSFQSQYVSIFSASFALGFVPLSSTKRIENIHVVPNKYIIEVDTTANIPSKRSFASASRKSSLHKQSLTFSSSLSMRFTTISTREMLPSRSRRSMTMVPFLLVQPLKFGYVRSLLFESTITHNNVQSADVRLFHAHHTSH